MSYDSSRCNADVPGHVSYYTATTIRRPVASVTSALTARLFIKFAGERAAAAVLG